jgi:hypothetical protein
MVKKFLFSINLLSLVHVLVSVGILEAFVRILMLIFWNVWSFRVLLLLWDSMVLLTMLMLPCRLADIFVPWKWWVEICILALVWFLLKSIRVPMNKSRIWYSWRISITNFRVSNFFQAHGNWLRSFWLWLIVLVRSMHLFAGNQLIRVTCVLVLIVLIWIKSKSLPSTRIQINLLCILYLAMLIR